jgi:hypothetical protein
MRKLSGRAVANASAVDRSKADFYPTPPEVTKALLDFWCLPEGSVVWECACGEGHMAEVIKAAGFQVVATDLYERGYGEGGVDFLTSICKCDYIVTNPPFNLAAEFIERAAKLSVRGFSFLLKSQYWHAAKRLPLFKKHKPAFICPLTWRPDFLFGQKGGAPTMECFWAIWGEPTNWCEYVPLEKPTE